MFCSCDVKLPKVCVVKAMVVIDVCVYRESTWITGNEHPSSPKRCSVESLKVFLVNKTNQYPKPTLARVQEPYFWGCCGLSMLTGCQSVMLCGCYWTMLNSWSPLCCGLLGSTIFWKFPEPHGPNKQGWRIDDSSPRASDMMEGYVGPYGVCRHWPSAVACWWAEICLERTNQKCKEVTQEDLLGPLPLPIDFSLSCFNKEPATGGSGLSMPCRISREVCIPRAVTTQRDFFAGLGGYRVGKSTQKACISTHPSCHLASWQPPCCKIPHAWPAGSCLPSEGEGPTLSCLPLWDGNRRGNEII